MEINKTSYIPLLSFNREDSLKLVNHIRKIVPTGSNIGLEILLEFRRISQELAAMGSFLEGVCKISRAELEAHGSIARFFRETGRYPTVID